MPDDDSLVLPEDPITDTVLALGTHLRLPDPDSGDVRDWLKVSPLMVHSNVESKLRRTILEDAIDEWLGALEDVCHRPVDRLRTVHRLVPVGAARRIVPATITRLAGHSEDWSRLRPDTVEPKVVLSPFRDPYMDFYENRVAARLVDHLWQEITKRQRAVSAIKVGEENINDYITQAAGRTHRMHGSLFKMISDTPFDQAWRDRVAARLADLTQVRNRIEALRGGRILPGVERNASIGTALRATNLFVNEHRYRRVRDLWHVWVADHTGTGEEADGPARASEFARAFTTYTALVVLHALDHLGAVAGAPVWLAPGRTIPLHGALASLTWSSADKLTISTAAGPLLCVVPLPHSLTREGRTVAGAAELARITAEPTDLPTLTVYPGSAAERAALPMPSRLAYFSGIESMDPAGDGPTVVPISPAELDSVLRLARNIRLAVECAGRKRYPAPVATAGTHAHALTSDWLPRDKYGLLVVRPPSPAERDRAKTALSGLRTRAQGQIHLRGELEPLDQLQDDIEAAANITAALTTCPVCRTQRSDPWRALHPRPDDGTYSCDPCQNCAARWEIRRCKSCREHYPVLRLDPAPKPGDLDGDMLDRLLGSELLAAPCWLRPTACICPSCGTCAGSSTRSDTACRRCDSASSRDH